MQNYDEKYEHLFSIEKVATDVNRKSVKAGFYNFASQGISLSITLVRAAILARLLRPDDYGVLSMVVVVASFVLIFKDLGLGTATVREKHIGHYQVSNLFWVNSLIGLVSMCLVVVFSPCIAWFYNDDRLVAVAIVLSTGFCFSGMSVQHQALLKRQMQFNKIALITVCASIFSSLIGCIIAYLYRNYWALVWMQVLQNFSLMVGFWLSTKWLPSSPTKSVDIRKFLKIGLDVAGLNAFSTLTKQIDKILIGKMTGAVELGLYGKGRQVPDLLSGQFRMAFFGVALPALSSLQEDSKRFAEYYYKFLNALSWLSISLGIFFYLFADEIIRFYFGPSWVASIPYMKVFAIYACIMPVITTLDQIPLSLGFSRRYLAAGVTRSACLVVCVLVAAPIWGVIGVAWGAVVAELLSFIPFAFFCVKKSPVNISGFWVTIAPAVVCSGILWGIVSYLKSDSSWQEGVILMLAYFLMIITAFLCCDFLRLKGALGVVKYLRER